MLECLGGWWSVPISGLGVGSVGFGCFGPISRFSSFYLPSGPCSNKPLVDVLNE